MKVSYYHPYAKIFIVSALAAVWITTNTPTTQAQSSSSSSETKIATTLETPNTPGFAPVQSQDQSQSRVIMRINAPARVSASAGGSEQMIYSDSTSSSASEWFKSPSLYAESLFTTSNDRRRFGARAFQYTVQAGLDFETKGDVIIGLMYSPSLYDGRIDDLPGAGFGITDIERESHFGTLYVARAINDYFFAGATLTGGVTDSTTELQQSPFPVPSPFVTRSETDSFTISPSVFLGAAVDFDEFALSSTVSYLYSESYFETNNNATLAVNQPNPSSFAQSTGTFTWLVQGTYFLTDTVDLSLSHKLTQIVHTNAFAPRGPNNGQYDHNWSTVGFDINWLATQNLGIYGGVEYDLFQRNFKETVTGNVGLSYNF